MILVALLLSLYVSVLIHELGHGVMGRLAGWRVTALGTGLGRVVGSIPLGKTRVFLGLRSPLSGVTFAFAPDLLPTKGQYLLYFSGGILFNCLLAGAALALDFALGGGSRELQALAFVNGMQALGNAFPFQANLGSVSMASDGARMLQIMGRGMVDEPPVATAEAYTFLSPIWRDVGDWESQYLYAVAAAQSWLALGDEKRCLALLEEAQGLGKAPSPGIEAQTHLVKHAIALGRGDGREARAHLEAAEGLIATTSRAMGTLRLSQGSAYLRLGGIPEAKAALRELRSLGTEGSTLHPILVTGGLVLELQIAEAQGDVPEVERLRARYEERVKGLPPGHQTLPVYQTLMRHYGRLQDWDALADSAQQGAYILAYFHRTLRDPDDKARFLINNAHTIGRIEAALRWADPLGEGSELDALFAPPEVDGAPSRPWMVYGLALTLLAFLSSYASIVPGFEAPFPLMTFSMAAIYAAPGACVQLLLIAFKGGSPRRRRVLGALSILVGSLVWGAALITAAMHLNGGSGL